MGGPAGQGQGGISIHAPREGGDSSSTCRLVTSTDFNPRPPRGGRRVNSPRPVCPLGFQSTPPARGATRRRWRCISTASDFNPRPPRGGRPLHLPLWRAGGDYFNPRPPRGGRPFLPSFPWPPHRFQSTPPARGATIQSDVTMDIIRFQSTPPARGATCWRPRSQILIYISIHAPREGGDWVARGLRG